MFWRKKKQQDDQPPQRPWPPDLIATSTLVLAVFDAALLATKPINENWTTLTGESRMSSTISFMVRVEMLAFFLHMMSRYAFSVHGLRARDVLQDTVVIEAIDAMLRSSFDTSQAKGGFDVEAWVRRMRSGFLEVVNDAEMGYSECESIYEGRAGFIDEKCLVGKLTGRISRQAGQEDNLQLRLSLGTAAVSTLGQSNLKQQVETFCAILR